MQRAMKIVTMLAVYLVWVCSNPIIALSCHAHHAEHIHCCGQHCECHHEGCEKMHFESPHGCHHDHSNTIVLYDTTKEKEIDIKPIASSTPLYLASTHNLLLTPNSSLLTPNYYERSESIPLSPTLSRRGLRAPPVIA